MGVAVSSHSALAPISLASTIIGFVSFAFTVTTWLRVFWQNLNTLFEAESEIHAYLSNLRIELWEERSSLRKIRKHNKDFGHSTHGKGKGRTKLRLDDATLKSMQDIMRHLTRTFKRLEQPFLEPNPTPVRRRDPTDPYARESGGWEDDVKTARGARRHYRARRDEDDDDDDDEGWSGMQYCNITLGKRFVWLRKRSEAISLMENLTRVQTRRIARQVGEISIALYEYGAIIEDVRDDTEAVSSRLNRIVGIRRVD